MDDASDPSKIGPETETPEGRGADGRFQPGNSGGPGRPEGSRNRATAILDRMAEDDANGIGRVVIDAAKAGDMRAAGLVLILTMKRRSSCNSWTVRATCG